MYTDERFECRVTDDATKQEIFEFFTEDIDYFDSYYTSVGWKQGAYSKDGTLFITQYSSMNGALMRTGTEDDNYFYVSCILFIKDKNGKWIKDTISYKSGMGKCIVYGIADSLKDKEEFIEAAVRFYASNRYEVIDNRTEEEVKHDDAVIDEYIDKLRELVNKKRM